MGQESDISVLVTVSAEALTLSAELGLGHAHSHSPSVTNYDVLLSTEQIYPHSFEHLCPFKTCPLQAELAHPINS